MSRRALQRQVLFDRGDVGHEMYLLIDGTVESSVANAR